MRCYVHVKFKTTDPKSYVYIADGDVEELSRFTHAVVDSPYGGLTVVEIVKFDTLDESSYNGEYKECITLFDKSAYDASLARAARKKAIEKELRARVRKRTIEDNFERLLEGDEVGLKLLEEFKSL